jgi:hypothetical protein
MNSFLLDAGLSGANLGAGIAVLVILFLIIVFIEAVVMLLFKLNKFKKCLTDSLLVNLASLVAGFILTALEINISFGGSESSFTGFLIAFLVTVVVEGFLLMALNRKTPPGKVWLVTVVMNAVTYGLLIIYLRA